MLAKLKLDSVRNLTESSLKISSPLCIIHGANGAGKTSILEALNILGTGRSFRTHQINQVITNNKKELTVYAELNSGHKVGVKRTLNNDYLIRINQENKQRLSSLAEHIPVRVMTPDSFLMLTAGAQARRQFIDFSVFHVEHSFATTYQKYNRLLKQRNALLKQTESYIKFQSWDSQLLPIVERINDLRQKTFNELKPYFQHYQDRFLPQYNVQYSLSTGVPGTELEQHYIDSFNSDKRYGYTTIGPHKADLRLTINSSLAHQVLSRGELKMLVASLILGQVTWLLEKGSYCYLLLDDLTSELDLSKQELIFTEVLSLQRLQTFITAIEIPRFFKNLENGSYQMFHVEHGVILEQQELT